MSFSQILLLAQNWCSYLLVSLVQKSDETCLLTGVNVGLSACFIQGGGAFRRLK